MKKILAALAAILLLFTACTAGAEGEFYFDTWDGNNSLKEYNGEGGDVVIPETVDGHAVTRVSSFVFKNTYETITGVTFPDTVRYIEGHVLNSMPNLEKVVLPEGLQVIGPNNLLGTPGVKEIVVPSTVFYIGSGCFSSDADISVTFTGPVPIMPNEFTLWRTETSTIYVPDDLYDEYAKVIPEYQKMEKSGKNAVIPEYVTPESDFEFDASTGTITRFLADAVRVDVPAEIGGVPVKAIGPEAFAGIKVFAVFLPEGIETIGDSAFEKCHSLTVINLPDSLKSVGKKAFSRTDLTGISWGNGLETIGEEAFSLTGLGGSVQFPASLKEIGREAFASTNITEALFGSAIEKIGERAFAKAAVNYLLFDKFTLPEIAPDAFDESRAKLEDVDLNMNASKADEEAAREALVQFNPDIAVWRANPEDVEWPSRKYTHDKQADGTYVWTSYNGGQTALTPFWTIGEEDGTNVPVTAIGPDVFRGNTDLKIFRVNRGGNFTTIGENAFRESGLEIIDLFDTVTILGAGALQDCKGITELTLPESLKTIGENALSGLDGLEKVTVKCDASLLPANVFANLPNLKEVTIEKGDIPAGFADGSPVETLVLGAGVTSIGERAFADTAINNIIVPDIPLGKDCFAGVKSTAVTAAANASDDLLAALTEMTSAPWYNPILREGETSDFLTMPDTPNPEDDFLFNTETGTVEMYVGKSETIVIPATLHGMEVRAIAGTFGDKMRDYTNTDIINNVTEWTHVRSVVIPETVTTIGDSAFSYCQQLESVVCYGPLETTGRGTFMLCTSLKDVTFMNKIKAIDNYCFDECPALENVWYPGTLDFIGVKAFYGCDLKTVIADAKEIRECAFMGNEHLTEAHIRGCIEKMELSAFSKCSSLDIICLETLNDDAFTGDNGYSGECNGDTKLIIPAEADEKQAKYLLRKWHTSNFGPIKDEEHVIKAPCAVPENPPRPER